MENQTANWSFSSQWKYPRITTLTVVQQKFAQRTIKHIWAIDNLITLFHLIIPVGWSDDKIGFPNMADQIPDNIPSTRPSTLRFLLFSWILMDVNGPMAHIFESTRTPRVFDNLKGSGGRFRMELPSSPGAPNRGSVAALIYGGLHMVYQSKFRKIFIGWSILWLNQHIP